MRRFLLLLAGFFSLVFMFSVNSFAVEPIIIDRFDVRFRDGAKMTNGEYVWRPDSSNSGHMFAYRMSYSFSGTFSSEKGALRFEFPAHIIKNRDGEWGDSFDCPYQLESDVSENSKVDFVYKIEGDKAVIYNWKPVTTGTAGYIEFGYVLNDKTFDYTDMTQSTTVPISVYATNAAQTVTANAEGPAVTIDTWVDLKSVSISSPERLYMSWQDSWVAKPVDADDWVYLIWCVNSRVGDCTQRYNWYLDDEYSDMGGEVILYSFGNSKNFGTINHVDNLTSTGWRYDYVLTRHLKSEHEALRDKVSGYTVENIADATMEPFDGIDDSIIKSAYKSWWIKLPTYENPIGSFWADKDGIYYGAHYWVESSDDISDYSLAEFKTGEVDRIEDLSYRSYVRGYPYPWTLEDGYTGNVADAIAGRYGKKKVDYVLTTDSFSIVTDTIDEPLTENDYNVKSIELTYEFKDAEFDAETYEFSQKAVTGYKPEDNISVYVKLDGDYVHACDYDLESKSYANINESIVEKTVRTELFFKPGVKYVKYTFSNAYYKSEVRMLQHIEFLRNDHTVNIIGTEEKVGVAFKSKGSVSQDGRELFSRSKTAIDYIRDSEKRSSLVKRITHTKNDKVRQVFNATWRIVLEEELVANNITNIPQKSGIFYDLLPLACNIDMNSIKVQANYVNLKPGDYEVIREDNYQGTGRTLLTVKIFKPTDTDYRLYYDTSYAWNSIKDYGRDLLNSVCYETGNYSISEGTGKTGGDITDSEVMSTVGSSTECNKYLYAERREWVNTLMSGSTGLIKQVRGSSDTEWTYDTTVLQNGGYAYQVRYQNDLDTLSKDLIFFDSLENFYQRAGGSKAKESDWHGTLESLDFSQFAVKGVKPFVYLSSVENLNPYDHHDIRDSSIWVRYDTFVETYGIESARAIAVDARIGVDGSSFVLGKDDSLVFTVYMRAPGSVDGGGDNPAAYNNIFVERSAKSDFDTEYTSSFYHQDYTQVNWRAVSDVIFKKVSSLDANTVIPDTMWRLTGTSAYGTVYDMSGVSNSDGKVLFKDIEAGTYELTETDCSADWLLNKNVYTVIVGHDASMSIMLDNIIVSQDPDGLYLIPNELRVHGDLRFVKLDSVTNRVLSNGRFALVGTSDYGTDVYLFANMYSLADDQADEMKIYSDVDIVLEQASQAMVRESDISQDTFSSNEKLSSGHMIDRGDKGWFVTNIEKGTYRLVEVHPPVGYQSDPLGWEVTVDGSGAVRMTHNGETCPVGLSGEYQIFDEKFHTVRFYKKSSYGTNVYLKGAMYQLYGMSDRGNKVSKSAQSDDAGVVEFGYLESGTYSLVEVQAPLDHDLDETVYTVHVNADDTFAIDGVEKDDGGSYVMINAKTKGKVRVVKHWQDDLSNTEREIPDMTISTLNPEGERLVTLMFLSYDYDGLILAEYPDVPRKDVNSPLYEFEPDCPPEDDGEGLYFYKFSGWSEAEEIWPGCFARSTQYTKCWNYTVKWVDTSGNLIKSSEVRYDVDGSTVSVTATDKNCGAGYQYRPELSVETDVLDNRYVELILVFSRPPIVWSSLDIFEGDYTLPFVFSFSLSNYYDEELLSDVKLILPDGVTFVSCSHDYGEVGEYDIVSNCVNWSTCVPCGARDFYVDLLFDYAGRFDFYVEASYRCGNDYLSTNTIVSVKAVPPDPDSPNIVD